MKLKSPFIYIKNPYLVKEKIYKSLSLNNWLTN